MQLTNDNLALYLQAIARSLHNSCVRWLFEDWQLPRGGDIARVLVWRVMEGDALREPLQSTHPGVFEDFLFARARFGAREQSEPARRSDLEFKLVREVGSAAQKWRQRLLEDILKQMGV